MFPSLIKEKKFIDTVSKLTIYIDQIEKNKKIMKNIFIKDETSGAGNFQIIIAKEGILSNFENKNFLTLKNGEIFNSDDNKTNSFKFENFEFNLSNFVTKTTLKPKIQETSSRILIQCFLNLSYDQDFKINQNKFICESSSLKNISEELLKRLYLPLYLPLISLIGCLLILKTKEEKLFGNYKIFIFVIGFVVIFFSEVSVKYSTGILLNSYLFFLIPLFLYFSVYYFFLRKLKYDIGIIND